MLSEEALIFLGGLAALGAVALGVLELLWPTRPRHPVRRSVGSSAPPVPAPPPATPSPVAPRRRWRSNRPRHAMRGSRSPYRSRLRLEAGVAEPPSVPPPMATVTPRRGGMPPPAVVDSEAEIVGAADRCSALYGQRAYPEVVALAVRTIAANAAAGRAAHVARLWSIVALAQQAMDERAAARAALESAIDAAPVAERPTYERQLAALAAEVARTLVAQAEGAHGPGSEDDLGLLREALDWLERAAAAVPAETELRDLAVDVQRLLWPGYERVVMTLVQRQQYRAARRLLREALDDPRFPAVRAETFRELFSGTYGGEIGQLTAQAIRSMHDARETEALGALERAEKLLDTVNDEGLPPERREEVDRRLWWGYKKLGRRRAQAGEYEAAAEALFHALRFAGVGTEREADTRAALVRALEGLVEKRALLIRELAEAGDREAALVQSDKLWSRLRGAIGEGLTEADLAVVFATAQRVFEEVGVRP